MQITAGQIAVVTGGGTGIGRALCLQLAQIGVNLATCDVSESNMAETRALALSKAAPGVQFFCFKADVSLETELLAFREAIKKSLGADHIHLLINNAGIGAGGGFVAGSRQEWERTFGVCWYGVYYGARTFMPLLLAAKQAHIVNVSSVNGFWASLGPTVPHTAYSAAKFAVKGFTEALITDLRLNAPHVTCSVVMPGHIGTSISLNTNLVQGFGPVQNLPAEKLAPVRARMVKSGAPVADMSDDELRQLLHKRATDFRDKAPTSADQAAAIILDGVRAGRWRILVGEDAQRLDEMVRENPEGAYDEGFEGLWRGR